MTAFNIFVYDIKSLSISILQEVCKSINLKILEVKPTGSNS